MPLKCLKLFTHSVYYLYFYLFIFKTSHHPQGQILLASLYDEERKAQISEFRNTIEVKLKFIKCNRKKYDAFIRDQTPRYPKTLLRKI